MSSNTLRVAVVGCGAVAEHRHLPALELRSDCEVVALVDTHPDRGARLARRFAVSRVLKEYESLPDIGVDLAIVALPNNLHAAASVRLLEAGVHVLVEKPMALNVPECDQMLEAQARGGVVLSVGMTRRFLHSGQFAKWVVDDGLLGKIRSFELMDGFVFRWPLATDFFFRKELAGGGTLIDAGVHALDQVLWWLGGVEAFEYYDDNLGGVESECMLHLTMQSGVRGVVELSRTRNLRNTAIIRGERGELEVGLIDNRVSLHLEGSPRVVEGQAAPMDTTINGKQTQIDLIAAEHGDVIQAIRTGCSPSVSGPEARRSIALVEECYRNRKPLELPWLESELTRK